MKTETGVFYLLAPDYWLLDSMNSPYAIYHSALYSLPSAGHYP